MLSRIFAIIRREYLERVRTKAFWISTIIVPVFLGAMIIIPSWLAVRGGGTFNVAVLDLSGHFAQPVADEVSHMLSSDKEKLVINLKPIEPGPDPAATRERVKNAVQAQKYDGMLVLPATLPGSGQPEYLAPNVAAFKLLSVLERSVNNAVVAARLTGAGLDPSQVRELTKRVGLKTLKLGTKGEETRDQGQGFLLSYAFMLIIYMSVLMYGLYVMRGVLEEKTNRIVEVVIATVKPFELMLGKILGIGAVGLTQFLIWGIAMMVVTAPGAAAAVGLSGMQMPSFPPLLMIFFVVYFVLGFLLFGTLYAGIGAAFDTEQEAQNFQFVIMTPLIASLLLMVQVINQPDSALSVVLSLIPFFTPMLMFLRMTLVQVPALQLAASVILMVATILGAAWVVGKIYRVGILMHGSKPKMKDLVRWIREA
ncbi:MAG: ABC transporter permease [Acidobacteria bacterium]|jgi:ABC-2 type transport system permease protein|nr:ABC transporter permease [Acidobacteriota bacterium]